MIFKYFKLTIFGFLISIISIVASISLATSNNVNVNLPQYIHNLLYLEILSKSNQFFLNLSLWILVGISIYGIKTFIINLIELIKHSKFEQLAQDLITIAICSGTIALVNTTVALGSGLIKGIFTIQQLNPLLSINQFIDQWISSSPNYIYSVLISLAIIAVVHIQKWITAIYDKLFGKFKVSKQSQP